MNEELHELVRLPREDMNIELKAWMDPTDKVVQAKLAKELLALQNHGGGYLVLGFKDEHPAVPDEANRPKDLSGFSTDVFNNIIKRYAEPWFHCMSHVVAHPDTGLEYPVIVVPGGSKVPIRCKADAPDGRSIRIDTYYTRRPGPESSPLQTAAEWDELLQRCLLNRKEELLAALSGLISGTRAAFQEGVESPPVSPFQPLRKFRDEAVSKLEALIAGLAEDSPARLVHGRYVLSARIVGELKKVSPRDFLAYLQALPSYTGWPPVIVFHRDALAPYSVDEDLIECWLARDPMEIRDAGHADFWRASLDGMVTLVRGHQEDEGGRDLPPPGKGMELTLPVWRIAEFILRIRHLGEQLAVGPFQIQLIVQWEGLSGRRLFSHGNQRMIARDYVAHDEKYLREVEITVDQVDAALPALVAEVTTPLMRRFSFFEPPASFYEQEVAKLMRR